MVRHATETFINIVYHKDFEESSRFHLLINSIKWFEFTWKKSHTWLCNPNNHLFFLLFLFLLYFSFRYLGNGNVCNGRPLTKICAGHVELTTKTTVYDRYLMYREKLNPAKCNCLIPLNRETKEHTWARNMNNATHSQIWIFDFTKSLKSSNLPDGSSGRSYYATNHRWSIPKHQQQVLCSMICKEMKGNLRFLKDINLSSLIVL